MEQLTIKIIEKLKDLGADMVGIGNLEELPCKARYNLPIGISVAVSYPTKVISDIDKFPTLEYLKWYNKINIRLDEIVTKGADYIKELGYQAHPLSRSHVNITETDLTSTLPHKTVATRAGIGWIGKSALLVTKEYGSAIRISSLLTNAPLTTNTPINESLCGDCVECVIACPGDAVTGENWKVSCSREDYYLAKKCSDKAKELSSRYLGEEITICGKCIEVCPNTRKYLE
jgi:epoxyqueuosine reductase QueG